MSIHGDHPLRPIVHGWCSKIKIAREFKKEQFGRDAEEAMNFYDGPHNWMWEDEYATGTGGYLEGGSANRPMMPLFRMQVNKVAEFVQLFLPSIYHANPHRQVTPRQREPLPPELFGNMMDPMTMQVMQMVQQQEMQQDGIVKTMSGLMHDVLNYTPNELDLKTSSRRVLLEAIVKGAGVWWTEAFKRDWESGTLYGSFYDSIDNLIIDPDAEQVEDVRWIARRCVHHIWEVEREYGFPPDSLKDIAQYESAKGQGRAGDEWDIRYEREKEHRSRDLVVYYKVYSRMGFGDRLSGYSKSERESSYHQYGPLAGKFEQFGDYCYLVICPGCPFPLNLPPWMTGSMAPDDEMLLSAVEWPIPFWTNQTDPWPCTMLGFHKKPNQVWPISHLKPGIGELRFLNWGMSLLASKAYTASNTILGCPKSASDNLKRAFFKQMGGYTMVEIEAMTGEKIDDILSFVDAPAFSQDLYNVIDRVAESFDKRVGLSEILYGMASTQSRSATDASVRQSNASVRIDDMRNKVEDASTEIARKEALAWRWMGTEQDVAPILGQQRTALWQQLMMTSPVEWVTKELEYRIEAGTMAKPNKMTQQELVNAAIQNFGPVLSQLIGMGQVGPFNSLVAKWAEAFDMDPEGMFVQPPPPMPPPGAAA